MLATAVDTEHLAVSFYPESAYSPPTDFSSDDTGRSLEVIDVPYYGNLVRARALLSRTDDVAQKTTFSLTDLAVEPYLEPSEQHARKQEDTAHRHLKAARAAKARILELKTDARAESHAVSAASEENLLAFLDGYVFTRRPFITLLDNGNLRALWKNDAGEQIGIQFRGGKQVQYVFFARREGQEFMARVSGRDSLTDIERQIEALNLERLMTA
jgi:hypothetical protein